MTAPMIEGIKAMPANEGPQLPRRACPTAEPTKPAKMLAIQPMEPPLVMTPASKPMMAPTISDQIIKYLFSSMC